MALEEYCSKHPDQFKLVFMEVDDFDATAARYRFDYVPTVRIYEGGQQVAEYSGDYSPRDVVRFVSEHITSSHYTCR